MQSTALVLSAISVSGEREVVRSCQEMDIGIAALY
jgi:hypothetical protein